MQPLVRLLVFLICGLAATVVGGILWFAFATAISQGTGLTEPTEIWLMVGAVPPAVYVAWKSGHWLWHFAWGR